MNDTTPPNTLTDAIRLCHAGYKLTPVRIVLNRGKKSLIFGRNWADENAWSSDVDQVRAWYADHPDTSYAVRTGRHGGVDVIDLDVRPDRHGVHWADTHNMPGSTMTVTTASGGKHLYFAAAGTPTTADVIAPGVDTRGDGGIVIAPGAHIIGHPDRRWTATHITPVADLPPLPAQWAAAHHTHTPTRTPRTDTATTTQHDPEWMLRVCRDAADRLATLPKRTGGSQFRDLQMAAAMLYGRAVDAGVIARGQALHHLYSATEAVWGTVDHDDRRNISQGLADGPGSGRWTVRHDGGLLIRSATETPPAPAAEPTPPAAEPPTTGTLPTDVHLPSTVWDTTPTLRHIADAAHATITSPDAVLAAVLAQLAATVDHRTRVHTGVAPSVLSQLVALVGPSGTGKSQAATVARDLMSDWSATMPDLTATPLGTGEGVIESLMGTVTRPVLHPDGTPTGEEEQVRAQTGHNLLLVADEGRDALAIGGRTGSILMGVLCSMWSGQDAGQANASADRRRKLAHDTYTMGAVLNFQPGTVSPVFADAMGGLPQRMLFAPAWDPSAGDHVCDSPGPLPIGDGHGATHPVTVRLTDDAEAVVRAARVAAVRGEQQDADPLDGHRMLLRARVAALLTLLHGSTVVDGQMWDLAGQILDCSRRLRDWSAIYTAAGEAREATARADARDRRTVDVARRSADGVRRDEVVFRALRRILTVLDREGGTWTRGRTYRALSVPQRAAFEGAVKMGVQEGSLVEEDGGGTLRLVVGDE